jgi:predicted ATPase
MLRFELASYAAAQGQGGPVIFDRGIPDIIGYLSLEGLPVPDELVAAAKRLRYNPRVFVAPPWPEIFVNESERRQSLAEADRTFEAMCIAYPAFDYRLVELPRASVPERADFVRAAIN